MSSPKPERLDPERMSNDFSKRLQMIGRRQRAVGPGLLTFGGAAAYVFVHPGNEKSGHSEVSSQSRSRGQQRYTPTPAEWASLTIQPVIEKGFRAAPVT